MCECEITLRGLSDVGVGYADVILGAIILGGGRFFFDGF